jgi:hypothetical protein
MRRRVSQARPIEDADKRGGNVEQLDGQPRYDGILPRSGWCRAPPGSPWAEHDGVSVNRSGASLRGAGLDHLDFLRAPLPPHG